MTLAYVLGFFATVAVVYAWILLSIDGTEGARALQSGAAVFPCPKEPSRIHEEAFQDRPAKVLSSDKHWQPWELHVGGMDHRWEITARNTYPRSNVWLCQQGPQEHARRYALPSRVYDETGMTIVNQNEANQAVSTTVQPDMYVCPGWLMRIDNMDKCPPKAFQAGFIDWPCAGLVINPFMLCRWNGLYSPFGITAAECFEVPVSGDPFLERRTMVPWIPWIHQINVVDKDSALAPPVLYRPSEAIPREVTHGQPGTLRQLIVPASLSTSTNLVHGRVFVAVTSIVPPRVYIWNQGFAQVAVKPFDMQAPFEDACVYDPSFSGPCADGTPALHPKHRVKPLWEYLLDITRGDPARSASILRTLHRKVTLTVLRTIALAQDAKRNQEMLESRSYCLDVLAVDFAIMADTFDPLIVRVENDPSFKPDGPAGRVTGTIEDAMLALFKMSGAGNPGYDRRNVYAGPLMNNLRTFCSNPDCLDLDIEGIQRLYDEIYHNFHTTGKWLPAYPNPVSIHDYDFFFDQPEVANTLVGRAHMLFKYWFDYNVNDLLLGIALFRDLDAPHEVLPKL